MEMAQYAFLHRSNFSERRDVKFPVQNISKRQRKDVQSRRGGQLSIIRQDSYLEDCVVFIDEGNEF